VRKCNVVPGLKPWVSNGNHRVGRGEAKPAAWRENTADFSQRLSSSPHAQAPHWLRPGQRCRQGVALARTTHDGISDRNCHQSAQSNSDQPVYPGYQSPIDMAKPQPGEWCRERRRSESNTITREGDQSAEPEHRGPSLCHARRMRSDSQPRRITHQHPPGTRERRATSRG